MTRRSDQSDHHRRRRPGRGAVACYLGRAGPPRGPLREASRPAPAPTGARPVDQPRPVGPRPPRPARSRPGRRGVASQRPDARPHDPRARRRAHLPALRQGRHRGAALRLARRPEPPARRGGRPLRVGAAVLRPPLHRARPARRRPSNSSTRRTHRRSRGRGGHRRRRGYSRPCARWMQRQERFNYQQDYLEPRLQGIDDPRRAGRRLPHGEARPAHLAARQLHDDRPAQPRRLVHLHAVLAVRGAEQLRRPEDRGGRAGVLPRAVPRRRAADADLADDFSTTRPGRW